MEYNKTIEIMATAFQEAALQPMTRVDAKRGIRAALKALQELMPDVDPPYDPEVERVMRYTERLKRIGITLMLLKDDDGI